MVIPWIEQWPIQVYRETDDDVGQMLHEQRNDHDIIITAQLCSIFDCIDQYWLVMRVNGVVVVVVVVEEVVAVGGGDGVEAMVEEEVLLALDTL